MRRRNQLGNALVETALVFMVFAVMIIAIIDFGQYLFIHQALTERARFAVRWGSIVGPNNTTAVKNMVLYGQSSSPEHATGYFGLTNENVSVSWLDADTDNARLTIVISGYRYKMISPYLQKTYTSPPITVSVPLGAFS